VQRAVACWGLRVFRASTGLGKDAVAPKQGFAESYAGNSSDIDDVFVTASQAHCAVDQQETLAIYTSRHSRGGVYKRCLVCHGVLGADGEGAAGDGY
jgi:hypothetical protein